MARGKRAKRSTKTTPVRKTSSRRRTRSTRHVSTYEDKPAVEVADEDSLEFINALNSFK